jgi:hypothetical protein
MALIGGFTQVQKETNRVHEGVECGWTRFERDGEIYLQLDTYGSSERQIPGKVSQSIQLDTTAATQLVRVIRQTFPSIAEGSDES